MFSVWPVVAVAAPGAMPLSVTDFGAKGDGRTKDTAALQQALDAAHAAGGGTVLVPPGRYLTGTLIVRSHTTVDLVAGATLLGSPDFSDYVRLEYPQTPWGGRHLVVVLDADQVTLRGQGTIDGQGWNFWEPAADADSWRRGKKDRPSAMLAVVHSRDVKLRDLHLVNPAEWHSDIYGSTRVEITGLHIGSADALAPNDDGIDISGSHDVVISNCHIAVGDDGIVINTRERDVRRVTITNCVISSQCAAIKVGWPEPQGPCRHDIRQVTVSNCVLFASNRGLAVYGNGGRTIEDVLFSNIVCDTNTPVMLTRPIHLNVCGRPDAGPGTVRNVTISNFSARTQGRVLMTAEPGSTMENVTLRDVRLDYAYLEDPGVAGPAATSGQFSPGNPEARLARAAVIADGIRNLRIENLEVNWPTSAAVPVEWRLPVKRENGGYRLFRPDYIAVRPVPFHALWAKNTTGRLSAPGLAASAPEIESCKLIGSDLQTPPR